jgi:hypothetical protein
LRDREHLVIPLGDAIVAVELGNSRADSRAQLVKDGLTVAAVPLIPGHSHLAELGSG